MTISDATLAQFVSIDSWHEVLGDADRGSRLWYHAPLDRYPCAVYVRRIFKNGKIWIKAGSLTFTVDSGHLSRFRRKA